MLLHAAVSLLGKSPVFGGITQQLTLNTALVTCLAGASSNEC